MRIVSTILILALLLGIGGCASMSRQERGTIIGAGSGAAIGGAIGSRSGNTALGAIIGAAVGGAAGNYIGHYMDKQYEEMERDLDGATIERVGEGIKITFDSGLLFDVNSAQVQPAGRANLTSLAQILNKYPDTNILIEGHTDSSGSDEYNMTLSRNRADSVANLLEQMQVLPTRCITRGYGETQPVADNATAAGRQANRRVEIAIFANDKLKKVAEEKAG